MHHNCKSHCIDQFESRRKFLQLAALGGGVSLLAATAWVPDALASGKTEALVLSCMDYRLIDDVESFMAGRGMRGKYDHVVLAGASLGAVTEKFPAWNQTFWEHLGIAIKLHHIHSVIIVDHRDCGAYKVILGADHAKTREAETNAHAEQLAQLKKAILEKHPDLKVETHLMSLNGKVEEIG
jgi:carbonic anhydrase